MGSVACGGSGRRIGTADVEVLTEQVAHLRSLDCHYGLGQTRVRVVQLLHRLHRRRDQNGPPLDMPVHLTRFHPCMSTL
jgi:hypothetical protein